MEQDEDRAEIDRLEDKYETRLEDIIFLPSPDREEPATKI